MKTEMLERIRAIFAEEGREYLVSLEQDLIALESAGPGDRTERLNALFRVAHSLKGAARSVGAEEIQHHAGTLEDHFSLARANSSTVNRDFISDCLQVLDGIKTAFRRWLGETLAPSRNRESRPEVGPNPLDLPGSRTVRLSAAFLDKLSAHVGELKVLHRGAQQMLQGFKETLEVFQLRQGGTGEPQQRAGFQLEAADSLKAGVGELQNRWAAQQRILDAAENEVRRARLMPLAELLEEFSRPIRDLAKSLKKQVTYDSRAGGVFLDRTVIEGLRQPLLHLLRNAVSHGLESPEGRLAAGKPAAGTVRILAAARGSRITIRVEDDGAGIDFDRVRNVAQKAGFLPEQSAADLSLEDVAELLFRPGFTTREEVDDVSGRGVGLDLVLREITRLHGTVSLAESSRDGCAFVFTVPVTVSTARLLTLQAGGQSYGIPTSSIVKTGHLQPDEIGCLQGQSILPYESHSVPWVSLEQILDGVQGALQEETRLPYVLLGSGQRHLALAVDALEDEFESVLKPLGFPLGTLPGILGGVVRQDGEIQLVLDPVELLNRETRRNGTAATTFSREPKKILVVDDSTTTRVLLRSVLQEAGYLVEMAPHGVAALDRLRGFKANLVVSDVDMPQMDGFELVKAVKARYHLPVVLVTGRESPEDRKKGLEVGADAYLVKSSYRDQGFVETVGQFL